MELNSNQIQEILPHRYPFQLVDRITDFEPGKWAKGVKCVSVNEMQFLGHFPTQHVMPGVLVIEALAQRKDCIFRWHQECEIQEADHAGRCD